MPILAIHSYKKGFSMSNKICRVGNLPYSVTNDSLKSTLAEFGTATSAKTMWIAYFQRSFQRILVLSKMARFADASRCLSGAQRHVQVDGRSIVVNLAKPFVKRVQPPGEQRVPRNRRMLATGNGGSAAVATRSASSFLTAPC